MKTFHHLKIFCFTLLITLIFFSTSFANLSAQNTPPTLSTTGLQNEKLFTNIFRGDFINIPFDKDETTFVLLLNEYIDAYAINCASSLPANKVELMRPECVTERVTKDGYGWEISRTCVEWVDVPRGLYATPEMRNAQISLEKSQSVDVFRNMYKMMQQKNPIGEALNMLETSKAIKADLASLIKMNGCGSKGLMRFQENLRRFAINKQPIPISGKTAKKTVISTTNQNFAKLAEDLVFEHSKKWAMNRYRRGSISNATITKKDSQDRPTEMTAKYRYTGWNGESSGSVRITFNEGLPECLYFFDFPTTCRSADRRLVSQFANGSYKK
ncbi:hypothetical protein [Algibacter sp. 2305UL17-15]|uniref:hypothetical protein n=1 Tax=Algibacter sp. 2305UL17-15 TaxID=3231268 RepID=UPI00345AD481